VALASSGPYMSATRSRQITMPVPHHSSFLQAGCPSCRPTNSVKALMALTLRVKLSICPGCLHKSALSRKDAGPAWFPEPHESTSQNASRSVHPFSRLTVVINAHRLLTKTDHALCLFQATFFWGGSPPPKKTTIPPHDCQIVCNR